MRGNEERMEKRMEAMMGKVMRMMKMFMGEGAVGGVSSASGKGLIVEEMAKVSDNGEGSDSKIEDKGTKHSKDEQKCYRKNEKKGKSNEKREKKKDQDETRLSRQHAVGPAGGKEGASPTCAPIADRSARHHLRETKSSRRHLSPSHHHQRSPKRSRGHSPAPSVEFSPAHSYACSPDRSRAYPPARHSPARHSPARSYVHAPAYVRHHSRPYDHLSPSRERSPTGRSPTVGHSDRKDPRQDAPPGRRSQDSPPRKRRITAEQGRSAERSRQSSFSFQEGLVVTTPKGREIPFSPAGIADTASVTRLPWFRHMIKAVVQAIKPSSTDQRRDPGMGSPPLKKRKGVGFVVSDNFIRQM
ncbi:spermatogenesis-associated protein 31H1-like [Palaemon carinicauda]|uniref:spermatogenesis-associated protein 31H1-like n=1 Tax=Palaemon carinicauda TaxID=392227 RepID=UPI0035B69CF9